MRDWEKAEKNVEEIENVRLVVSFDKGRTNTFKLR